LVQSARSTAVFRASSASSEPSVARRILVGKMLISCSFLPLLDALRVDARAELI
jgi:hypothetical protein